MIKVIKRQVRCEKCAAKKIILILEGLTELNLDLQKEMNVLSEKLGKDFIFKITPIIWPCECDICIL